jgi:hypothetical protein
MIFVDIVARIYIYKYRVVRIVIIKAFNKVIRVSR